MQTISVFKQRFFVVYVLRRPKLFAGSKIPMFVFMYLKNDCSSPAYIHTVYTRVDMRYVDDCLQLADCVVCEYNLLSHSMGFEEF